MTEQVADCGCWTDENGYWQLSEQCLAEEHRVWAETMSRWKTRDKEDKEGD